MMLIGVVGAMLLWAGYLPIASTTTAATPSSDIVAPGNRGIITQGQTGGQNTILQEDNLPRRKMRDLFNSIDPNILGAVEQGETKLKVRMQPYQITQLQDLIKEEGAISDVSIDELGGTIIDSAINNGTFGTMQAVHLQRIVLLTFSPNILTGPTLDATPKQ